MKKNQKHHGFWLRAGSTLLAGLLFGQSLNAAEPVLQAPGFSAAQAERGQLAYQQSCASCHGAGLEGLALVPSLAGTYFAER